VVKQQGYVPFGDPPIHYRSEKLDDPVARLQRRLARGDERLTYEPSHGYLRSVLQKLDISESSQTLVFSKTSFQFSRISPERPRALYFNDDVYVGQVTTVARWNSSRSIRCRAPSSTSSTNIRRNGRDSSGP
jgi:hypothetical protein